MTLDQAIEHAEQKAKAEGPCAQEHAQLAVWLRELRAIRGPEPEAKPGFELEESIDRAEARNQAQGRDRWHAAALCFGYNELAKQAQRLGEKVYFRLACQLAEKNFVAQGGNHFLEQGRPVLELPDQMPFIRFTERDIELMDQAVRAFYAAKKGC